MEIIIAISLGLSPLDIFSLYLHALLSWSSHPVSWLSTISSVVLQNWMYTPDNLSILSQGLLLVAQVWTFVLFFHIPPDSISKLNSSFKYNPNSTTSVHHTTGSSHLCISWLNYYSSLTYPTSCSILNSEDEEIMLKISREKINVRSDQASPPKPFQWQPIPVRVKAEVLSKIYRLHDLVLCALWLHSQFHSLLLTSLQPQWSPSCSLQHTRH